jgi:hypothetical protein
MADQKSFGMKISQLLDKTTVVVAGEGIERLGVGDMISVLAIGPKIHGVSVPLVIPKAELEVDAVTKYYVIARSLEYETTVDTGLAAAIAGMTQQKVRRRDQLRVDEKQLIGNPALAPVTIGDPVVATGELSEYVDHLAATLP